MPGCPLSFFLFCRDYLVVLKLVKELQELLAIQALRIREVLSGRNLRLTLYVFLCCILVQLKIFWANNFHFIWDTGIWILKVIKCLDEDIGESAKFMCIIHSIMITTRRLYNISSVPCYLSKCLYIERGTIFGASPNYTLTITNWPIKPWDIIFINPNSTFISRFPLAFYIFSILWSHNIWLVIHLARLKSQNYVHLKFEIP